MYISFDASTVEDYCRSRLRSHHLVDKAKLAYGARDSAYHNWNHALKVVDAVQSLYKGAYVEEITIAALCHDVIHTNNSPTDEELSALWMLNYAKNVSTPSRLDIAADLIKTTAYHLRPVPDYYNWLSGAYSILMDADLAGLAGDWDSFLAEHSEVTYEIQLCKSATDEQMRVGRMAFIAKAIQAANEGLLFRSEVGRLELQPGALGNLHRLHDLLSKSKTPYV